MKSAFTLIELLIVVSIVAMLAGLMMPMVTIAKRSAEKTNTQALLAKVGVALDQFRSEMGVYPYLSHTAGFPVTNRLAYHLAHNLDANESSALQTDIGMASGRYSTVSRLGTQVIGPGNIDARNATCSYSFRMAQAAEVNAMAAQRARLAILAGFNTITGIKAFSHNGASAYDYSGTRLVPNATSQGWGGDYLARDIATSEIDGNAIVDRWKKPLVYICTVLPGGDLRLVNNPLGAQVAVNETYPQRESVGATSFLTNDSIPVVPEIYGLGRSGRVATTSLASDMTQTAANAFTMRCELWSAGPDRAAAKQRDAIVNKDNIPAEPYQRDLK